MRLKAGLLKNLSDALELVEDLGLVPAPYSRHS